jgi:hypothetical protein
MNPKSKIHDTPALPLAYLLPVAELCICLTVAVLAIPNLGQQIRESLRPGRAASLNDGSSDGTPRHKEPVIGKNQHWDVSASQIVWLANMPGIWAEFASSTHTMPYSWFPAGFVDLDSWRAVFWPFAALPFWFCAGRGMDFFLHMTHAPPRIGWVTLVLALVVTAFGAFIFPTGLADSGSEVRPPALDHALAAGGALWLVLGAICCAAWVVQWVLARRDRSAAAAQA